MQRFNVETEQKLKNVRRGERIKLAESMTTTVNVCGRSPLEAGDLQRHGCGTWRSFRWGSCRQRQWCNRGLWIFGRKYIVGCIEYKQWSWRWWEKDGKRKLGNEW